MKKYSLILIILMLAAIQLGAGWARSYGGKGWDEGHCIKPTSDGNYIITGITGPTWAPVDISVWLLKIDPQGDTIWTRTYTYEQSEYNVANCVQQTNDGGYIIVGATRLKEFNQPYFQDIWLIKTDSLGDTIWTRIYDGYPFVNRGDNGYYVQQTDDDGYIIVGTKNDEDCHAHIWLLRTDESGDTLWTRTYDGAAYCIQTTGWGYALTGTKDGKLLFMNLSHDGDTLSTRTYGWRYERGRFLQQTKDGGFIILGNIRSYQGSGGYNVWLLKTNAWGDTLWTRTYGTPYSSEFDSLGVQCVPIRDTPSVWIERGHSLALTSDDGYIIVGEMWYITGGQGDLWLIKTDSLGGVQWMRIYGGRLWDVGYSIQETSDGGYITVGKTHSFSKGDADLWIVRTDSNGDTLTVQEKLIGQAPAAYWDILSPIGRQIVLQFSNNPSGFDADIFDVSGSRVDKIYAFEESGVITWGENHRPGVYFIRSHSHQPTAQKVIIIP